MHESPMIIKEDAVQGIRESGTAGAEGRQRGWVQDYTLLALAQCLGVVTTLAVGAICFVMAREVRARHDLNAIKTQLKGYECESLFLPTTEQGLQALVTMPSIEPVPTKWRQLCLAIPMDPWGRQYMYKCPGEHRPKTFDLYSLGPDGVESGDDIWHPSR